MVMVILLIIDDICDDDDDKDADDDNRDVIMMTVINYNVDDHCDNDYDDNDGDDDDDNDRDVTSDKCGVFFPLLSHHDGTVRPTILRTYGDDDGGDITMKILISTEGTLRLPTTYDNHPIPSHPNPSHPIPSIHK